MKRITCIITAFLTFLLISINSLSVYALPPELPYFTWRDVNIDSKFDSSRSTLGHIILYNYATNSWRSFSITTAYSYRNNDYIELTYDEVNDLYFIDSQNHLSSDTKFYYNDASQAINSNYVEFCYYLSFNGSWLYHTNSSISNWNSSNLIKNSIKCLNNDKGYWEIALSTVNIKYGDTLVFQGSTSNFYSFYDTSIHGVDYQLPYPSQDTPVEPPTEAPTIGEGEYDKVQAETSKNILENVKNIISAIANLPVTIANNIMSFFTDLLSGIITGLNNLKDGIIQGLKDLFIPSDNAFTDIVDMVKTKFSFAYEFLDIAKTILVFSFDDDVEAPNFEISDSSGKWFKGSLNFIDWTIYEPYRPYVHALILAISWYQFIERTIKRLPSIIGGI